MSTVAIGLFVTGIALGLCSTLIAVFLRNEDVDVFNPPISNWELLIHADKYMKRPFARLCKVSGILGLILGGVGLFLSIVSGMLA